jgi:hypothetical protein
MCPTASTTCLLPTITPHQHYTAPYLSYLANLILTTPHPSLRTLFDASVSISSHLISSVSPSPSLNALTQRVIHILNLPVFAASVSTVPYALCLLLRYRLVPHPSFSYSDETLLTVCILLAHKFLTDAYLPLRRFAAAVDVQVRDLVGAEKEVLGLIGYGVWVEDEEFEEWTGVMDGV